MNKLDVQDSIYRAVIALREAISDVEDWDDVQRMDIGYGVDYTLSKLRKAYNEATSAENEFENETR